MLIRILLFSILFTCLSISVSGQTISENFCQQIDAFVVQPLKPLKFNLNEVFSDECWFEFTTDSKGHISITIEKYNTKKEAHKDLQNSHELFILQDKFEKRKLTRKKLNTGNSWDEVVIYEEFHFALLRKLNFKITLFAQDIETLIEIEKLLRNVYFNS